MSRSRKDLPIYIEVSNTEHYATHASVSFFSKASLDAENTASAHAHGQFSQQGYRPQFETYFYGN